MLGAGLFTDVRRQTDIPTSHSIPPRSALDRRNTVLMVIGESEEPETELVLIG